MPRDKPAINVANGNIVNFNACNATSDSFKIKKKQQIKQVTIRQNNVG